MTTGHEWNGIEELNTPVPRPVYIFLGLAFTFSVIYWLLMPAWPLGVTYTRGLLGVSQHSLIDDDLKKASADKASWTKKIEDMTFADIQADASLMHIVRETTRPLFADNCAACHGAAAQGGPGYPNLTSGAWLWGGTPEAIMETLRVGVNSPHEDTRTSQMMAFGRDGILTRDQVLNVVAFVQSLSNPSLATGPEATQVEAGREVFAKNCAACHGPTGTGNTELGAPNLADNFWIYGGD
jgi:cytochrome c oxidase cbb3-type subunit 3